MPFLFSSFPALPPDPIILCSNFIITIKKELTIDLGMEWDRVWNRATMTMCHEKDHTSPDQAVKTTKLGLFKEKSKSRSA